MISGVRNYSGRPVLVRLFFIIGFIFLISRLFYVQIFQDNFIKGKIDSRIIHKDYLPAKRGKILDRNDRVLALDVTGYSLEIDLDLFNPNTDQIISLVDILETEEKALANILKKKTGYKVLKRHITDKEKNRIKYLNLKGIHYRENLKRSYPQMEISSHVVGITDTDRVGIQGTELVFNRFLEGKDGIFTGLKSPLGVMEGERSSPSDGSNLKLTIDIRLQSIAYHELKRSVENYGATSGSIVIIDPKNADILALTNFPSFNPSNRKNLTDMSTLRNRATVDIFQPGSVLKPLAMAAIIDSGKVNKGLIIDTSPGWIEFGGYKTRDFRDYGELNLSEIISYSSNVGMVKLCKDQDSHHLIQYFSNFGVGILPTNILIPSREGFLPESSMISERDKVSSCYGYGLSMSAIQIAQAYQVFANKGIFKELNLFHDKRLSAPKPERRVLSQETTRLINNMLFETVNSRHGTAKGARIGGLEVAGKTGTAEKIRGGKKYYTATFSGFAPSKDPKLLAVIVLHNLIGEEHSGGKVAAPIFSKVISQSLHALESGST